MTRDVKLLEKRIACFVEFDVQVSDDRRVLALSAGTSVFEAFRREVEETERARRLTFRNDRGEVLTLDVKGGCILGMMPSLPPDASKHAEPDQPSDGDPDNTSLIAALDNALEAFLAKADALSVSSAPIAIDSIASGRGVPISRLLENDGALADTPCIDATGAMGKFTADCGEMVDTLVWIDTGKVAKASGSETDIERLKALARSEISENQQSPDAAPRFFLLSGRDTDGSAVLCGSAGLSLVLTIFNASMMMDILNHWQRAFAPEV